MHIFLTSLTFVFLWYWLMSLLIDEFDEVNQRLDRIEDLLKKTTTEEPDDE